MCVCSVADISIEVGSVRVFHFWTFFGVCVCVVIVSSICRQNVVVILFRSSCSSFSLLISRSSSFIIIPENSFLVYVNCFQHDFAIRNTHRLRIIISSLLIGFDGVRANVFLFYRFSFGLMLPLIFFWKLIFKWTRKMKTHLTKKTTTTTKHIIILKDFLTSF